MMNNQVYIIAEAGVNHNGDINRAMRLIEVAAESGADAVKFQTFSSHSLATRSAPKAEYQLASTNEAESQQAMLADLELSYDSHHLLKSHAEKAGITFLSSAFDIQSLVFLSSLDMELIKVPSGEITNVPYLRAVASIGKPVVLSSGMATVGEIEFALGIIEDAGIDRSLITLLHCNTEYPTPMPDVNLRAMQNLGSIFGVKVGYSDHTNGIEISIAAVALGACLIEKHFTLDRNLPGPDHKASLEPQELRALVSGIRNVTMALGDGIKRPTASELKNRPIARKSLVALCPILKGEIFSENNLTAKRPATGVSAARWDEVIGRTASRSFNADEIIEL